MLITPYPPGFVAEISVKYETDSALDDDDSSYVRIRPFRL